MKSLFVSFSIANRSAAENGPVNVVLSATSDLNLVKSAKWNTLVEVGLPQSKVMYVFTIQNIVN